MSAQISLPTAVSSEAANASARMSVASALLGLAAALVKEGKALPQDLFREQPLPLSKQSLPSYEGGLMLPTQASKALGLSPKTLANWRVTGEGPAFLKVGGRVRYHRQDLADWQASRKRSNTSVGAANA